MSIEELLQLYAAGEYSKFVKALKSGRSKALPDIAKFEKQWTVKKHETIINTTKLPDKKVKKGEGEVLQPVNRIAIPIQKNVVNKAVSFAFGNPVALNAEPDNDTQETLKKALQQIDKDVKLKSHNRRIYRELLRATEVAELWYQKEKKEQSEYYGFSSNERIRVAAFMPFDGDILFPFFDELNDLIAFSREYIIKDENGKDITHFDVYTDELNFRFKQDKQNWVLVEDPIEHGLGKIPVVYMEGDDVDWADIQIAIDRLEFLLSKFAETNDYHASPTIFVQGKIIGMPEKGESGKILEGAKDTNASYLSWDHAPESVRLEIDTLLRFIHGLTQTPDVSFDSVKGLSSISGVALNLLFMDAHLKVQEKKEILDEFLQRRVNLQLHMLGKLGGMEKEAELFNVEPEIIPFHIDDEKTTIENISAAVGGGFLSRRTAIKILGWVKDAEEEWAQIQEEEKQSKSFSIFEPTNDGTGQ